MSATAMIRTEALTVRYDDLVAVDSLTLEVPEGAVYGFIGPNGAGKTSTIRVLATLLEPAQGRAWVGAHDVIEDPHRVQALIGYMPDFFGVYDHLFVWEYLELFGELHGLHAPKLTDRITAVLSLCDLETKRDAMVGGLSRGMKQRLCLARALLPDPPVLILDEPASGVDPKGRYEIRRIIRTMGDQGKTVLVSSHILLELAEVCDHVGVIEAGKLRASGPIDELMALGEPTRVLRIRLVGGDLQRAAELLRSMDVVREAVASADELKLTIPDRDVAQADVLARLSAHGFRIGHVAEERADLEKLYHELTRGELA
jgi:ABC-2 type transport system ATP-binding protein